MDKYVINKEALYRLKTKINIPYIYIYIYIDRERGREREIPYLLQNSVLPLEQPIGESL